MAISTLARQGEDKIARQAYQRRQDEIYFYNKEKSEYERRLEEKDAEYARRLEEKNAEYERRLEEKNAEYEQLKRQLAELLSQQ